MIFGEKELERFHEETRCWICHEKLTKDDVKNYKVRDHCHFTGRYRGAAHKICNLKYRKPNFTPVVFHNLSGYDIHLFVKHLSFSEGNIDCIPNNEEKYISFTKRIQVGSYKKKVKNEKGESKEETKPLHHQIRFINSFKFMATSLEKLMNNLSKESFDNVRRYNEENELISLLMRMNLSPISL